VFLLRKHKEVETQPRSLIRGADRMCKRCRSIKGCPHVSRKPGRGPRLFSCTAYTSQRSPLRQGLR